MIQELTETEYIIEQLGNHAKFHYGTCYYSNCDCTIYGLYLAGKRVVETSKLDIKLKSRLMREVESWNNPLDKVSNA